MRGAALFLIAGLVIAGCQRSSGPKSYSDEPANLTIIRPSGMASEGASAPAADTQPEAAAADAGATSDLVTAAATVSAGAPMLAYSYGYGLTLPGKGVPVLLSRHEAACTRAGYRLCQVVSSSIRQVNRDNVRGELILRAAPAWLKSFREGLAGDAKANGGRLSRSQVTSEDLSREIVDTEARLKARITLRDRLQALLASRPGKLSDLLDVERELARVQGEIDSIQSQLAIVRGRVATSDVTVTYTSLGAANADGGWSPLAKSLRDFVDIVAQSLAGLVRFLAWVGPWVAIGGGVLWLLRKRVPKLRWPSRPKAPPPAP